MKVNLLAAAFPIICIAASCYMFYLEKYLPAVAYMALALLTWVGIMALRSIKDEE